MPRVTGIGGVFFKSRSDQAALAAWYERHLGLTLESWGGAILKWPEDPRPEGGLTVWHTAPPDTKWFAPSDASFMINYRVDDLEGLLANLRTAGVTIVDGPTVDFNGSFAWILDPDGNKLELWEPKASEASPTT